MDDSFPFMALAQDNTWNAVYENVDHVVIDNQSGKIRISSDADVKKVAVMAQKVKGDQDCRLQMVQKEATLELITRKTKKWFGNTCNIKINVVVPEKIALNVDNGSGEIVLSGVFEKVDVDNGSGDVVTKGKILELSGDTGSGNMDVDTVLGDIDLDTGSGNINITSVAGKVVLETGSGDVSFRHHGKTLDKVKVSTGSGNVNMHLPKDAIFITQFSTGSGKVYNEFGDRKQAQTTVYVDTGSGNLNIYKN
ncbi:MAG: DUF4097 family beta strand repeat-containing protein [Bdellovibrionota bacterium]